MAEPEKTPEEEKRTAAPAGAEGAEEHETLEFHAAKHAAGNEMGQVDHVPGMVESLYANADGLDKNVALLANIFNETMRRQALEDRNNAIKQAQEALGRGEQPPAPPLQTLPSMTDLKMIIDAQAAAVNARAAGVQADIAMRADQRQGMMFSVQLQQLKRQFEAFQKAIPGMQFPVEKEPTTKAPARSQAKAPAKARQPRQPAQAKAPAKARQPRQQTK